MAIGETGPTRCPHPAGKEQVVHSFLIVAGRANLSSLPGWPHFSRFSVHYGGSRDAFTRNIYRQLWGLLLGDRVLPVSLLS